MKNNIVWVTGSSGFIGRKLVNRLNKEGFDTKCFSNNINSTIDGNGLDQGIQYMNYSLEDSIKEQIDKFGCPNIVIHAGWGGMTSPMSDHHLRENVCNGKILIDTLYSNGLEKFIYFLKKLSGLSLETEDLTFILLRI